MSRRVLSGLLAPVLGLGLAVGAVYAQVPGGLNLQFSPSPSTAQTGQPVTFSYSASPPAVAPPFASITSISIDFGDGQSGTGQTGTPGQTVTGTITHAYNAGGAYTPVINAKASNGGSGTLSTSVTIQGGSAPPSGPNITYGGGWNLIGVPDGTVLPPTEGLYTYQNGSYQSATTTRAGTGYWASFPNPTNSIILPASTSAPPARVTLPSGQWAMVGNPYSVPANISGADIFYGYDPEHGYAAVTTLAPGLGAWAYSTSGGTAVVAPALLR
jgi:hypothetical protein